MASPQLRHRGATGQPEEPGDLPWENEGQPGPNATGWRQATFRVANVEDALDGHLGGRRVAGHEGTGLPGCRKVSIIDTYLPMFLPARRHSSLCLLSVDRLELRDVADGQELRRVATTSGL